MARTTLDNLYALTIPEVQQAFLNAMQGIVDEAMLDEMVKAIEAGDEESLFRATGFTPAALAPILDRIEQAYKDGADFEVGNWPSPIKTPTGYALFRFNVRNARAEQEIKDNSSQLISQLTNEARDNVKNALQQGMIEGQNPRTTALNIVGRIDPKTKKRVGGVIGLTTRQAGWAQNAETYLKQFDEKYFNLGLRDKRFDSTVRKAFKDGKPLSADQIQKLVTSYKNKALKYRADVISRTESIHSINRGRDASYYQAFDEGALRENQVTKEWDDVGDTHVRTTHKVMGEVYGKNKGIPFSEPFVSPRGSRMMFPGDQSLDADASEVIQCRCRARYRVDWLK